jgi:hypothetical protein
MSDPLVTALTALIAACAAYISGLRIERGRNGAAAAPTMEQLVTDAVAAHYADLVAQVTELRALVDHLETEVQSRDVLVRQLELDKSLYLSRIEELEREVAELRDRLGGSDAAS